MHKVNVAKDARLQLQVIRRTAQFDFALTMRTTAKQNTAGLPACAASTFVSYFINADKTYMSNGKTTSPYVYYPSHLNGAAADTTVYVTIQTKLTSPSLDDGYYAVCKAVQVGRGRQMWGGTDGVLCPHGRNV